MIHKGDLRGSSERCAKVLRQEPYASQMKACGDALGATIVKTAAKRIASVSLIGECLKEQTPVQQHKKNKQRVEQLLSWAKQNLLVSFEDVPLDLRQKVAAHGTILQDAAASSSSSSGVKRPEETGAADNTSRNKFKRAA